MARDYEMPLTDDYMRQMYEKSREEWFGTPEGARYKQQYEQLKEQMKNLHSSMDAHICQFISSKYPMR